MEFIDIYSFILTCIIAYSRYCRSSRWVRWELKQWFNSQSYQKYFCQKLFKSANFFRVIISNVRDVFPGFLFISRYISLDLLSLGSAEVDSGWGGKLNGHLMASCVVNICTKNYQNLVTGFQVTIRNVRDVFWDTVEVLTLDLSTSWAWLWSWLSFVVVNLFYATVE